MKYAVFIIAIFFIDCPFTAMAQDSITQEENLLKKFTLSGYADIYYSYDFNRPENNDRAPFLYNFNRHNEVNINLAFLKASFNDERVRANLALAAGTYMNANYSAEPSTLKNLFEANVGFKISRKQNLWLDIGVMPSHIGFESAIGKDNWTLTRSMLAENSPYFETGIKLGYTTKDEKLSLSALALNGWQRIKRVDGNSLISWGTQVNYKASDKITINYSTFLGTDKPDSSRLWRFYHNLYAIAQLNKKVGLTAGFDIGHEQNAQNKSSYNVWYSPVIILRVIPVSNLAIALRGEYYKDKTGVIISTGTANGFDTFGASLNFDYSPTNNLLLRIEGRYLNSKDKIFPKETQLKNNNSAATFSASINF
jgi:hypothetical protein